MFSGLCKENMLPILPNTVKINNPIANSTIFEYESVTYACSGKVVPNPSESDDTRFNAICRAYDSVYQLTDAYWLRPNLNCTFGK